MLQSLQKLVYYIKHIRLSSTYAAAPMKMNPIINANIVYYIKHYIFILNVCCSTSRKEPSGYAKGQGQTVFTICRF